MRCHVASFGEKVGSSFPDGCKEKILIKDANFPSWRRGPVEP
jgi:hypothetical protein